MLVDWGAVAKWFGGVKYRGSGGVGFRIGKRNPSVKPVPARLGLGTAPHIG
jgi:hypothetical protein